jgi:hypothetical protein
VECKQGGTSYMNLTKEYKKHQVNDEHILVKVVAGHNKYSNGQIVVCIKKHDIDGCYIPIKMELPLSESVMIRNNCKAIEYSMTKPMNWDDYMDRINHNSLKRIYSLECQHSHHRYRL